jgi:hypothetical protein
MSASLFMFLARCIYIAPFYHKFARLFRPFLEFRRIGKTHVRYVSSFERDEKQVSRSARLNHAYFLLLFRSSEILTRNSSGMSHIRYAVFRDFYLPSTARKNHEKTTGTTGLSTYARTSHNVIGGGDFPMLTNVRGLKRATSIPP